MADPWYQIVRPIWSDVVDNILSQLCPLQELSALLVMSKIVTPENTPEFSFIASVQNTLLFPEVYLVAASLGGETSFTSFLSLLKSWPFPGSQPLAHELERLWKNSRKKSAEKKHPTKCKSVDQFLIKHAKFLN